jgi:prepilin-type N-terminal cleavage/methylation domain-containing protein
MKSIINKLKKLRGNRGFTLVESLVAITILVLAVSGAFSAAQTGLSTSSISKEQITAFYLAQEQIEALRNMIDETGLGASGSWVAAIPGSCSSASHHACYIDIECWWAGSCTGGPIKTGNPGPLKIHPTTGFYIDNGTNSWTDSIYSRGFKVTAINADEISVLVTVTWSKGLLNRQFTIRENFLNWRY